MFVLSYSQILCVARRENPKIRGVEYSIDANLRDFVAEHLPTAGDNFVDGRYLLVASNDPELGYIIVAFSPGGPPDTGFER